MIARFVFGKRKFFLEKNTAMAAQEMVGEIRGPNIRFLNCLRATMVVHVAIFLFTLFLDFLLLLVFLFHNGPITSRPVLFPLLLGLIAFFFDLALLSVQLYFVQRWTAQYRATHSNESNELFPY